MGGAQDFDGERIVACSICSIWHHSRCSGIEDAACCASLMPSRSHSNFEFECFVGGISLSNLIKG